VGTKKCKKEYERNRNECGCGISIKEEIPYGLVIKLPRGWLLNHYGGKEGFLGWLALQPREHREQLCELNEYEQEGLGKHIQSIEATLRDYWKTEFRDDGFERMYVFYFSEYSKHLHFHLISRTRELGKLALCSKVCSEFKESVASAGAIAWNIPFATKCEDFPDEYKIAPKGQYDKRVGKLMDHLKNNLPGAAVYSRKRENG